MLAHALTEIHESRPQLTLRARVCVEAALLLEGSIGPPDRVARFLGVPSRFALARLLKRERCPGLRRLSGWVSVLSWTVATERRRVSLANLAYRIGRHPSACYRLVKSVTGLTWHQVSARGPAWVERQLLLEFGVKGSGEKNESWLAPDAAEDRKKVGTRRTGPARNGCAVRSERKRTTDL